MGIFVEIDDVYDIVEKVAEDQMVLIIRCNTDSPPEDSED